MLHHHIISCRRRLRTPCRVGGPRARCLGRCQIRTLRRNVPPWQFHLWSEWCRKQLGQRSLHRGRWARWECPRCGPQGVWGLWLSAGLPAHTLVRRRHRLRYGHTAHQQNTRRIPGQNHEHVLYHAFSKGMKNILERVGWGWGWGLGEVGFVGGSGRGWWWWW